MGVTSMSIRIFFLLALAIPLQAWSPLVDHQPALEHSHGLFGNPAALGSYDGAGWLLTYAPDTAHAGSLRLGLHSENVGFSMNWIQDESRALDHTFWHGTFAIPSPGNMVSLGLRGTLWRSSAFRGNAFSASPGILAHPFAWLSLGWTGEDWLANKEFQKVHRYGIAFRPIDALVIGGDLSVDHYRSNWYSQSPLFGQADLILPGFTLGARIPLKNTQREPFSLYLSAALGHRQSLAIATTRNGVQSYGIDGHLALSPSPLASSHWVKLELATPLSEFKSGLLFFEDDALSLPEFLMQVSHLENEPSIQGVVIDFDGYTGNAAASQEIRRAIQSLRKKGKRTLAYLTQIRPGILLAASAADRIAIQPSSQIHFRGLSFETTHFKGFLDKLGVRAELIRHGRYKSAVEAYTLDSISPDARQNYTSLMESLWATLLDSIAVSRQIPVSRLDTIASKSPLTTKLADSLGLVDTILQVDDIPKYLKTATVHPWKTVSTPPFRTDWRSRPRIAVVTLEGEIVDGSGQSTPFSKPGIGARTYSDLVDYLRSSPEFSGLVLRIHSPGGSAQASEMLWHRFRTLGKDLGIPVVASVGGMAASGGYYIACAADEIYAEPTSIVGSIGIFGGKIDASGLMQKLGIRSSVMRTHEKADAERMTRAFTEEERQIVQGAMDDAYQSFVSTVSEARHMSVEAVDKIGEGQVFTGAQALKNGLVDHLGGLEQAIRATATRAGIPPDREIQTHHIHFRSGWNIENGRLQSLAMDWLGNWIEGLEKTQVWAMWNGPAYLED